MFSSHVGCLCGSHPQRAWASCCLWCTNSNNTPEKETCLGGWETETKSSFPKAMCLIMQCHPEPALPKSFSVLSLPLKFTLGLFHLKKMIYIYRERVAFSFQVLCVTGHALLGQHEVSASRSLHFMAITPDHVMVLSNGLWPCTQFQC